MPSRCPSHHVMSNGNITDVKPCDSTTFRSVNAVQPFLSDFQEIQVQLQGVSRQGRVTLGSTGNGAGQFDGSKLILKWSAWQMRSL